MNRLLCFLVFCGFASTASAGLYLEPYVGYEMATMTGKLKSNGGTIDSTGTAYAAGLKLGYMTPVGFWVGADGESTMSGTVKYDNAALKNDDYSRMQAYVDVGFNFPVLLNVWAGYALMNQMEIKTSSSTGTFSGGSAYKAGLGFRILPLLMLGVEYRAFSYADVESGGTTRSVDAVYSSMNDSSTVVTINMPFSF